MWNASWCNLMGMQSRGDGGTLSQRRRTNLILKAGLDRPSSPESTLVNTYLFTGIDRRTQLLTCSIMHRPQTTGDPRIVIGPNRVSLLANHTTPITNTASVGSGTSDSETRHTPLPPPFPQLTTCHGPTSSSQPARTDRHHQGRYGC